MTVRIGETRDIGTCRAIRETVFIREQGVPESEEIDGRDGAALHLIAWADDTPVGTARILIAGDTGKIGRFCVLKDHRGRGIGAALMHGCIGALRRRAGIRRATLSAQTHAIAFYERLGFTAHGPEYPDAGILHRDMDLTL